jgi:hypothetical protein
VRKYKSNTINVVNLLVEQSCSFGSAIKARRQKGLEMIQVVIYCRFVICCFDVTDDSLFTLTTKSCMIEFGDAFLANKWLVVFGLKEVDGYEDSTTLNALDLILGLRNGVGGIQGRRLWFEDYLHLNSR